MLVKMYQINLLTSNNLCLCIIFLTLCVENSVAPMTDSQLKAAAKVIRNACQPKTKVTDEQIDNMHKGIWDDDKRAMCYNHCLLLRLKLVGKDGKLDLESSMKQLPQLPDIYHPAIHDFLEKCKGVDDHKDKCAASYYLTKCFYFLHPDKYLLP